MKKIFIILLLFVVGFSSCDIEGESTDVITPEQTGGMESEMAKRYMSGVYTQLFNTDLRTEYDNFGLRAIMFATDLMTDDIAFSPTAPIRFNFDYANDNRALSYRRPTSTWKQLYAYAASANSALAFLEPKLEEGAEATEQEEALAGQAYGLRAYCYFLLINMFQQPYSVNKEAPGVPIYTTTELKSGRNTVAEVYDFILSDLELGYKLLEDKKFTTAAEINKYMIAGLYARVLSFVDDYPSQWTEVAKYADIALQKGDLMSKDDLLSGFNSIGKSEIIWGSSIDDTNNTYWASWFPFIDPFCGGYTAGREPKIASFLFNKMDATKDVRIGWFATKDEVVDKVELPKWTTKKFIDKEGGFVADYIYMRTAEMHFIKAEALYLSGKEGDAKDALETIVKTRISGYTTAKTGADLLDEIRIQKRIEMWGEGLRLFDMKWRGEALDRSTSTNHMTQYTTKLSANPKEWVYQIPDSEMNANDEITENNP